MANWVYVVLWVEDGQQCVMVFEAKKHADSYAAAKKGEVVNRPVRVMDMITGEK